MNSLKLRCNTLAAHNASESEIEELLAYNQNVFDHQLRHPLVFPLEAEPHIEAWEQYAVEAKRVGVYHALKLHLVQFQFPIVPGISETEAYRAATRKGKPTDKLEIATGLVFTEPEKLELRIHHTLAGPIPIIIAGNRKDFVTLVQALTSRNEPQPVPDSMGACIVGGYNNWHRVLRYKQQWSSNNPEHCSESEWRAEFKRLISHKELYQDRFIILSPGIYSNVTAAQLGLSENEWQELSLTIRLEHECTHYFTRRLLGSMRNNLLDELIADYRGIVAAIGHYRADWFLHFVGLESFPLYREGGRLQNYRGDPPLSEGAFKILQALVKTAAENLERFELKYSKHSRTLNEEVAILVALTTLTIEELASELAISLLEAAVNHQRNCLELDRGRIGYRKQADSKK